MTEEHYINCGQEYMLAVELPDNGARLAAT